MIIPKNEAKSSGIWAARPHLAKMRNGATKKTEILFKKTLTQTGGSEKLAPHTE
jgi:replicative DNA helicase